MERRESDGGLWMKMDSNGVSDHAAPPAGGLPDEDLVLPPPPAAVSRYYSVMDDEGADDVFILLPPPPPPPDVDVWLPAGGGTDETAAGNSAVTLWDEAADATEAEANPSGLDRHNGEKPLRAAPIQVDNEGASAVQTSRESMDNTWPSDDSSTISNQDQTSMDGTACLMERRHDAVGPRLQDESSGNEESNEDFSVLSGGQEKREETGAEIERHAEETTSDQEETERRLSKGGGRTTSEDIGAFNESKRSEGNLSTSGSDADDDDDDDDDDDRTSSEETELCNLNKNEEDEHVDSRSLDYHHTKNDWVRRESGGTETQMRQLPISKSSMENTTRGEEEEEKEEEEDRSKKRASDIQQGELLLQRLQMLQLRHDSQETSGEGKDMRASGEDEDLMEKEKNEKNEGKEVQTQAEPPSRGGAEEEIPTGATEAGDSEDDVRDSWEPLDVPQTSRDAPFLSAAHRLSAAETSMEKQIQEEAQRKQNLQRAGGVFNLADDPDVLEIPFKTSVTLESLPAAADVRQRSSWHKMQKEISQEVQRERVPVHQGAVPGEDSRGEVRHIKETKLVFEAFQQDTTEGPTRLCEPSTSVSQDHMYPSVLERTRSLEMFTLTSSSLSRAHSLRVVESAASERDRSPENRAVKSPTGGPRDKTRLAPYSKQEKHLRLHKSMDAINDAVSGSSAESKSKTQEENMAQRSPILQKNPFVTLRPALALRPEVEKDIREAREREEELRRQRCSLYGEKKPRSEDEERSRATQLLNLDLRQQSRGKLERVWPPPSKKDPKTPDQREPKVQRAAGQRAPLWQRWEAGLINGTPAKEKP